MMSAAPTAARLTLTLMLAVATLLNLAACTMEGTGTVSPVPNSPSYELEPAFPHLDLPGLLQIAYPADGSNRLFAVLKEGQIVAFENSPDVPAAQTFLDIRGRVNAQGSEEGLLGLAFDPDYRNNGYFYVNYTASNPRRSVISRFSTDTQNPAAADPGSELVFLEVAQPFANHNGGQLAFGPDGYLYIGLGDGGGAGDPFGNGQDTSTLLGSILRIDVSSLDSTGTYGIPPDNPFAGDGTARGEIWAYGLRNPWRFSFDRLSGELWAGDVGQNSYEEIDIIKPAGNYGWNIMEGFHCFRGSGCDTGGLELPIVEYDHSQGCSVTGGYVYRGSQLPSLYGAYIYGDYCSGKVWSLRRSDGQVTENFELVKDPPPGLEISAFGEDQAGELYILSLGGQIYRLRELS